MSVFGLKSLNFTIENNFLAQIFGPVDNFKQASKQKKNASLKFEQCKHQL